jgi:hypothetical protein
MSHLNSCLHRLIKYNVELQNIRTCKKGLIKIHTFLIQYTIITYDFTINKEIKIKN